MKNNDAHYLKVISSLRPISTFATFASFIRVLNTRRFPAAFLLLPSLLIVILVFEKNIANDRHMKSMFTGATVGLVIGFLSDADKLLHIGSTERKIHSLGINKGVKVIHKVSTFQQFLSALELLHIPVLIGSIFYTFCVIFNQLPPMRLLILSFALSICCSIIVSLIALILKDMSHANPKTSYYSMHAYIDHRFLFFFIFSISIFPFIHGIRKKTWLFLLNIFYLNILWQIDHLDTTQWQPQSDTSVGRFPVAGSITSIIFAFAFDCVKPRTSKRRVLHWTESDVESADEDEFEDERRRCSATFVAWYCGAYVVERLILFYAAQLRRTAIIHDRRVEHLANMDTWLTCVLMICAGYLFAVKEQVGLVRTVLIFVLVVAFYFSFGIVSGFIGNGHLIDSLFSLAFISII